MLSEEEIKNIQFYNNMGLDCRTIIMFQDDATVDKILVMLFEVDSLDKIAEFFVNTWNPDLRTLKGYEESKDLYSCQFAKYNGTK